jgi:hypothetical protein
MIAAGLPAIRLILIYQLPYLYLPGSLFQRKIIVISSVVVRCNRSKKYRTTIEQVSNKYRTNEPFGNTCLIRHKLYNNAVLQKRRRSGSQVDQDNTASIVLLQKSGSK